MRILLAAEEAAGTQVLRMLSNGPDDVVGVLTGHLARTGLAGVAGLAERRGIPVFPAERVTRPEFAEACRDVDLFLNVHSLFKIHPALLAMPAIGTFNLHPGRLPAYAGLNAPSWAVYFGEEQHAVTLHWVVEEIDAGSIAYASEFPIGGADTGLSVSARCVRDGIPLFRRLLDTARANPDLIPRVPQPREGRRVFLRRSVPKQGRIDWSEPADRILRLVRACDYYPLESPWGAAWSLLGDARIEIQKARTEPQVSESSPGTVFRADETGAWIATRDATVVVEKILFDGRSTPCVGHVNPGSRFS